MDRPFVSHTSLQWQVFVALIGMCACLTDMDGPIATGMQTNEENFKIEGRAIVLGVRLQDWISAARVIVEGEEHVGFFRFKDCTEFGSKVPSAGEWPNERTKGPNLRSLPVLPAFSLYRHYFRHQIDGSFTVNNVPPGSYVVQIVSPSYRFEPVRVDITTKGKMRARIANYIKPSEVVRLPYPLQMRSIGPHSYFVKRETWGWSDFLMNPMVMMMVLPLIIILLLPKVVNTNDPEMRREMEQSMNMLNPNHELPDVSEFMTKLFSSKTPTRTGGGGGSRGPKGGLSKRR